MKIKTRVFSYVIFLLLVLLSLTLSVSVVEQALVKEAHALLPPYRCVGNNQCAPSAIEAYPRCSVREQCTASFLSGSVVAPANVASATAGVNKRDPDCLWSMPADSYFGISLAQLETIFTQHKLVRTESRPTEDALGQGVAVDLGVFKRI